MSCCSLVVSQSCQCPARCPGLVSRLKVALHKVTRFAVVPDEVPVHESITVTAVPRCKIGGPSLDDPNHRLDSVQMLWPAGYTQYRDESASRNQHYTPYAEIHSVVRDRLSSHACVCTFVAWLPYRSLTGRTMLRDPSGPSVGTTEYSACMCNYMVTKAERKTCREYALKTAIQLLIDSTERW
jgi:hypothetical protein